MIKNRILLALLLCYTIHLSGQSENHKKPSIEDYLQNLSVKDSVAYIPGMFKTYLTAGFYYWEIPDSLLGRDLMVATIILKGSEREERSSNVKYGYGGDQVGGPLIIRLKKEKGNLTISVPFWDRLPVDTTNHLFSLANQLNEEGIIGQFTIHAQNEQSFLVDITPWLNSSVFSLSPFAYLIGVGNPDRTKSYIKEIKGLPENLIIRSVHYFQEQKNEEILTAWEIGTSVSLLPKEPYRPRYADSRVGYFKFGLQDLNTSPTQIREKALIRRWRMEPREEDMERYQRGELVVPRKPIIFYIDRETPKHLIPHFIHSVNVWQGAFEKAGFKKAIETRLAPTPEEDPNFAVDDIRKSYISYKSSPLANAYGPSMVDPRTGEILCSHIGVYTSIFQLVQRWYFTQCGLTDPRVREIVLPDSLLGWLSELVITHEVGHTLGLTHNFMGSNTYSVEQIRDTAFVRANGFASSIMDYVRFNYVAQPEDGFKPEDLMPGIGPYDQFAIEWGYRYFPGMTLEEERDSLNRWVSQMNHNKRFRFGQEDSNDPRSQAEDMGNDHVESNIFALENLRQLLAMYDMWQVKEPLEKGIMKDRYDGVLTQYGMWVKHVIEDIGGKYILTDSYTQTGKLFQPVERPLQDKAFVFLDKYLFLTPDWLFDPIVTQAVGANKQTAMTKLYKDMMGALVFQMGYVIENEKYPHADTYSVNEYIEKLHHYIFQSWQPKAQIKLEELEMQRIYVSELRDHIRVFARKNTVLEIKLRNELRKIAQKAIEQAKTLPAGKNKEAIREMGHGISYWLNKN